MTPADLAVAVLDAVSGAVEAGQLQVDVPAEAVIERPKSRDHGDYATNIALRLAKPAGRRPRDVAEVVAGYLRRRSGVAAVDVAGPGFLNITLENAAQGALVETIIAAGTSYGYTTALSGQKINLEFVSANPTGLLHLAHVRWAAVGDAMARLLAASGARVTTEYYFNDAGSQIDRFAASLYAVAQGEQVPADGYHGEYVIEVAQQVVADHPGVLDQPRAIALEVFQVHGIEQMFAQIRAGLDRFGVHFDVYFNERDLHRLGRIEETVVRLRTQGHVYEKDGAVWLRTTDFGDDKDRVIVRSDGRPTYFCADLAYYVDKRDRGFDRVVIILGADHHGYVPRMRALVRGLGEDPDQTLEIPIGQMVTARGGKMSKRAGNVLTLDDLIEAVGVDAGRYAMVRSSMDSAIDIDLDLWASRTSENPVFYVQYAHARIASLLRNAADLSIDSGDVTAADLSRLREEREGDLLAALGEFPRVVTAAAELRAPHRVARYLEELAGTYHRFYDDCRILPRGDEDPAPEMVPRLWLCEATRLVLANGLGLLGVSAPDRM
ncbi:MAG: arginine--tRNA ligase [Geodermatophilaceae bacterium]|nr:arginine--tRNA ligase [Geodermatophilaceae bacterium]MDQ3463276.1 arginine--tRNA ligase [Actinomycetota bacterium]